MPELPEVETVCNALRPHLRGREIVAVEPLVERLRLPLEPAALNLACRGRVITDLRRRGKFMILEFANTDNALLMHLGMTGRMRITAPGAPLLKHDRVLWHLDDCNTWRLNDARRFSSVVPVILAEPGADPAALAHLGPEPLGPDFNAAYLSRVSRNRRKPVKNLIMDQEVVVGVGNIYASEALFIAGISPLAAAADISGKRWKKLVIAIRDVLRQAIAAGGTTISDFQAPDGSEGGFQQSLNVYGGKDRDCPRCHGKSRIQRLVIGGRSTFFCARCQK